VGCLATKTGENLVQVCDLTVTYVPERGMPVRALEGANFEVKPAEVIGILGESGSGKSTLAQALLRVLPPLARYERGGIRWCGSDLLAKSDSELRKIRGAEIALIPQDPALSLNPVMRVGVQISEVLRAHMNMTRSERFRRVEELLREVGFDDPGQIGSAYPHQLSGGQRQRVVIAQAIACVPSLVIADEPTSKLDAPLQAEIMALMADIRLRHGVAFLVISHDPTVFAGFADRMLVMYAGRIIEQGNAREIFQRPLHPYTQALVDLGKEFAEKFDGRPRSKTFLPVISGDPPDLGCATAGCSFEPRCSERMQICTSSFPPDLIHQPSRHVSCFKYGN